MLQVAIPFAWAVLVISPVWAQSGELKTPEGKLASSAGAYLASLEYLQAFKGTECAYALPRDIESFEAALRTDVLPAFRSDLRGEVSQTMRAVKPVVVAQAKQNVDLMVAAALKDYDKNTGCGVIAGTLAATYARVLDKWQADKQSYRWKGR